MTVPARVRGPLGRFHGRLRGKVASLLSTDRAVGGQPPAAELDRVGTDPVEAAVVRAGWLIVDAHERLGTVASRRTFGHELDAWFGYARRTLPNLEPWEAAEGALPNYQNDNNRLRFRRVLDFVRSRDRVFDIGVGRGYLCGVLMRDGGVAAYHGIDILERSVESTRQMLAANRLEHTDVSIELADLFELTRDRVARSGASLVICCEVLEHIPEPERALQVMAHALPNGADLLFSVPLHGRLEAVWGHCTTFDVARLKAMTDAAGLTVHHVEPLANCWTLVVASRDRRPSRRVREATGRPPVNASVALQGHRDFVNVDRSTITPGRQVAGADCELEPARYGRTVCQVAGQDPTGGGQYGGVGFPVSGLTAMRLEIGLLDFTHVRQLHVEARAGADPVGRWVWEPTERDVASQAYRRFAFRLTEVAAPPFRTELANQSPEVDRVEVLAEIEPGRQATFSVRAAYLP